MKKTICIIVLVLLSIAGFAQQNEAFVVRSAANTFHQALVRGDTGWLKALTHEALYYGHSNGWVQNKRQILDDLKSGLITYQRYSEDSMSVTLTEKKNIANVCFAATIDATMKETSYTFHLKVLEVWTKENNTWMLIARQAVKG